MKSITLTEVQYKCLREHLNAIELILVGKVTAGSSTKESIASKPQPKESRATRIKNYKMLIESGNRGTKPKHLKK